MDAAGKGDGRRDRRTADDAAIAAVATRIAAGDRGKTRGDAIYEIAEGATAGGIGARLRVGKGTVAVEAQRPIEKRGQIGRIQHRAGAGVVGQHTLARVGHIKRPASNAVIGFWIDRGSSCSGRAGHAVDVGHHAAAAPIVGREAQLAVVDIHARGGADVIDQYVLRLARGQEYFVLDLRDAGQHVTVLGNQRHTRNASGTSHRIRGQRANDRGYVHAQARVDQAHQHGARDLARGRELRKARSARVEGNAIDQEVARVVIDRRRITGVRDADARVGVAALVRQTTPDPQLIEASSGHRRVDGRVLHGVDFTEDQGQFGVVSDARVGCARSSARGSIRNHQYAVETHRTLDRGVCARLDQIGAGAEVIP